MQVYDQYEWLGIARRGAERRDPRTSWIEINTRPGEDELKRIEARQAYYPTALGSLAAYWPGYSGCYRLIDNTGAPCRDFSYSSASAFQVAVCFQANDPENSEVYAHLFGATKGPDVFSAMSWMTYLYCPSYLFTLIVRRSNATTVESMEIGATSFTVGNWYWADISFPAGTGTAMMALYENGGTTPIATTKLVVAGGAVSGTYDLTVGGLDYGNGVPHGVAVAYAACGSSVPAPWHAAFGEPGGSVDVSFLPTKASYLTQPARINDSANALVWAQSPRYGLEYVEDSTLFASKGVRISAGGAMSANLSDLPILNGRTVFLVKYRCANEVCLLRSNDCSFMVTTDGVTATDLVAYMNPLSMAASSQAYGGLLRTSTTSGVFGGTAQWLAVELDPDVTNTASNLNLYTYTTGAWASHGFTTATNGNGFLDTDFTKVILGAAVTGTCDIYDFRVSVGDEGWKTTYTPTAVSGTLPDRLYAWLNHDTTAGYVRRSNVASVALKTSGLYDPTVALTDRVNGEYRFSFDHLSHPFGWSSCPYLKGGVFPAITDVLPQSSGAIDGHTEGGSFSDWTPRPVMMDPLKGRKTLAKTGPVSYSIGDAHLSRRSRETAFVGSPRHFVVAWSIAVTRDWKGALSWATTYRYRLTLYDPATGTESNPYGQFRFTTGAAPTSTTAPTAGTPGCGCEVSISIETKAGLRDKLIRFYRYHEPSGVYYLEGAAPVLAGGSGVPWTNRQSTTSKFTFRLSDDELSMMPPLQYDNNEPPIHTLCGIWAGRAWFVDGINPSRIWCSKLDQPGSVPGTNVITTDEGVGGDIIGLLPGFGGLLLLRERSIWIIPQFLEVENAYAQPLINGIGCVSGQSAVFAENILWWASPTGITSFDGEKLTDHSDRIKGVDRAVWQGSPRSTLAYYDRVHYRLVFVCDGAGVTLDIRSGAVSLVSAPETAYAEAGLADYAGPLYGGHGMVFKECAGNRSLTLSSSAGMSTSLPGPTTAGTLVPVLYHWHDGTTAAVGTATLGYEFPGLLAGDYLTASAHEGRAVHFLASDRSGIHAGQVFGVGSTSSASSYALIGCDRAATGDWFVERVPLYYGGQDLFLGAQFDSRVYERVDWITGDQQSATATAAFACYAKIEGRSAELAVSVVAAMAPDTGFEVGVGKRGNQFRYTFLSSAPENLPEIKSLRVRFSQQRPGSRDR